MRLTLSKSNLLASNAAVEAARAGEIKKLFEVSNDTVRQGTALVASAGKTIEDVVERVATMADVVGVIARDAQEQCTGIEAVARKVAEVETSNSENANLLAGELGGAVGRFRIEGAAPAASSPPAPARRAGS